MAILASKHHIYISYISTNCSLSRGLIPSSVHSLPSGDFGFSKDKFDDSAPQTQLGTALFTAPEVFLNVNGHVYEGEAVDVWSLGVVCMGMGRGWERKANSVHSRCMRDPPLREMMFVNLVLVSHTSGIAHATFWKPPFLDTRGHGTGQGHSDGVV